MGILRERIAASGPISFREYMEAALYHPEHGYYASARAQTGRHGDFFTNVSVGPLFGQLMARQFAEMWESLGRPGEFTIVEQGAHGGEFAGDALRWLAEHAAECYRAVRYRIVEPTAGLRARQEQALAGRPVEWFSSLEELPAFTGVHFSNELIDAFPVHVIRKVDGAWRERCVDWQDGRFVFTDREPSGAVRDRIAGIPELANAADGYETELNLETEPWLQAVAARMERGFVLLIDYGHPRDVLYAPERSLGTLRGYLRHQMIDDPLLHPGQMDLTTHVDFTTLMQAASALAMEVQGFTDQHHLMVGLGAAHFPDGQRPDASAMRAFQTLMHPTLMGTSFKVLCLSRAVSCAHSLSGFRFAPKKAADAR